jgi:hypothetical protein
MNFSGFVNQSFFQDITFHVVMQDPAILSAHEKCLVIYKPKYSCGYLKGFCLSFNFDFEISKSLNLIIDFIILRSINIEDSFEVVNFDA